MSYNNIRFEVSDDGIALLTVNRPEKLNALNSETVIELGDAVARSAQQTAMRVVEKSAIAVEIVLFDRDGALVGHAPFH